MRRGLLQDEILHELQRRIEDGELAAGTRLLERKLSEELGVSRTPLRKALFRLQQEGWLSKEPSRSFVVHGGRTRPCTPSEGRREGPTPTLRMKVVDQLRDLILSNKLVANTILRESSLAAQLGVSRTPAREALLTLVREGLVRKQERRGFRVSPLEAREVLELYPLRALLESEALRQAGIPALPDLEDLQKLNQKLGKAAPGREWIQLDNQWHERLVSGSTNRHLLRMLERLRQHSVRYELAFLDALPNRQVSLEQHDRILERLQAGDLAGARETLAENMKISIEPLLSRIDPLSAQNGPRG